MNDLIGLGYFLWSTNRNKSFIRSWLKEYGDFLLLNDGTQIPISRGKKQLVKDTLRIF